MAKKILPSKEIIICTPPPDKVNSSGIYVPSGENKPELGVVYGVGLGKLPVKVKVGDIVAFRKYTDNKIFIDHSEYNFISFKDILGVVK